MDRALLGLPGARPAGGRVVPLGDHDTRVRGDLVSGDIQVTESCSGGQSRWIREHGNRLACIERPDFASGQPGQPDFNFADLTRRPNSPLYGNARRRTRPRCRRPCARNPFSPVGYTWIAVSLDILCGSELEMYGFLRYGTTTRFSVIFLSRKNMRSQDLFLHFLFLLLQTTIKWYTKLGILIIVDLENNQFSRN